MISVHSALIYTMVLASAADSDMTDAELLTIGDIVEHLPVFDGYDTQGLPQTTEECAQVMGQDNGLYTALDLITAALPEEICETAYALACDVVAVDGKAQQEELRMLELIRHNLDVDRLTAAAIERGARARFRRLSVSELS